MYQKIILVGNLGRDPEMRITPTGQSVTNFSMATSETWNGQDGQRHERTIWFRVSVFGKAGEACNEYLKKGSKVLVEGRLTSDEKGNPRIWQDKEGNSRSSFEVTALAVKFLTGRGESSDTSETEPEATASEASDTEIPF